MSEQATTVQVEERADRMQALVNYEPEGVELREVEVPDLGEAEALIRVEAVGICGSDIHQWHGSHSWGVNYPVTLGHEFGGVIEEINGDGEFELGDRVVCETAAVIDEKSPLSRQGKYNLDPDRLGFGYGDDGAMARYVAVPVRCLHHVPDGLAFERAALTEPCSVAYNAVCQNAEIDPGDSVLVLGPGTIGLLCVQMASLSGASHVIANGLPVDEDRLDVAEELGATDTVTDDPSELIAGIGDGLGVDTVIDASGHSATFETAMDAVRPDGHITKVGWGPQPMEYSMDPVVQKAVTVQGSFSHTWPTWEKVLTLLNTGQLDVEPIVDRVAPLEEWHECFEGMHDRQYIKCVLTPNR
ncbi:zinc-binding dehydrogenase [Haladaptatus salinisoli]|uniref:zinc-binding dehydrogenase n=1 Tax=Haladaptatus salinisoli TaxID=2884876 RepID=UPI001D0A95F7|nr:zinc-binding dehydrogenase [Haladaptatus salinisoli]